VYIEETGAGDGDIKVTVDGEDYTAEANFDLDADGMDDTIAVMTEDGYVAYIDEDHDGHADVMQTIDGDGQVTQQARFHEDTGEWTGERPGQNPSPGRENADQHDRQLVIDTPQGDEQVGMPTEDTNSDGVADTAVVEGRDGATMMVTDVDGDGSADQVVEISTSGDVKISHHTGEGQWTVVEQGRINDEGRYAPDPNAAATDDTSWTFEEPDPQRQHPVQEASAAVDQAGGHRGAAAAVDSDPTSDSVWN
jgi:hypothetical protein